MLPAPGAEKRRYDRSMAAGREPFVMSGQSHSFLEALDEVSEAVESGAGLPSVTRAAGRALDASVIVLDASSSVLAVACSSPEDERAHGKDERIAIDRFYEALEFWYRMIRAFAS